MLTQAENALQAFIAAHPQLAFTDKHGGGKIRLGPCRWVRVVKHETFIGPMAVTLGWWYERGWSVSFGASSEAGALKNKMTTIRFTYPTFAEAAHAFVQGLEHIY